MAFSPGRLARAVAENGRFGATQGRDGAEATLIVYLAPTRAIPPLPYSLAN